MIAAFISKLKLTHLGCLAQRSCQSAKLSQASCGVALSCCCDGSTPAWRFSRSRELSPRMFSAWLWCSSRSSTAGAITLSPRSSPHSPKLLLEIRMMLPCSYRAETSVKKVAGRQRELVYI